MLLYEYTIHLKNSAYCMSSIAVPSLHRKHSQMSWLFPFQQDCVMLYLENFLSETFQCLKHFILLVNQINSQIISQIIVL